MTQTALLAEPVAAKVVATKEAASTAAARVVAMEALALVVTMAALPKGCAGCMIGTHESPD